MLRIGIIGRTASLYSITEKLATLGHKIVFIISSKAAPEYSRTSDDFEKLAERLDAHYIYSHNISNEIYKLSFLDNQKLDVGISINYTGILSHEFIDVFKIGILNAHGGDLPKYRGNACQAWAILNGENKVGLCIHKMKGNELDAGEILCRKYFEINENTRIGQILEWMEEKLDDMFLISIDKLVADNQYILEVQSKNSDDALRCYPRNADDGKIDWTKPAIDILRLINASSEPYGGAFCFINGEKVGIWRAAVFSDGEVYSAIPGQISYVDSNAGNVIVISGQGKLMISEISKEGKRFKPSEIIKSIRIRLK